MTVTTKIIGLLLVVLLLLNGATAILPPVSAQDTPLVLAFYYAWFDQNTWSSGQTVDLPAELYNSADRATIERHVAQAQGAGIDALVQSWYGPADNNPTETNFRTLLDAAGAKGLKAAVDVEVSGPFFGDKGALVQALAALLATHAQHPAYLRYQGLPVIFFWRQQRFSVDEWIAIRNQIDPNRSSLWIAEGTDLAYQAIFDGHHLYSVAWAASPADQLAKWGNRVRAYEADHAVKRLWVATIMPGYDDTRLARDGSFAVSRRGGDYYRENWQAALASQPDMLIITSFNEWPEGTQIEPSASYGGLYLDITREMVTALRGHPPAAPAAVEVAAAVAQATAPSSAPTPEGPYITATDRVNVRSGPATSFDRIGQLLLGEMAPAMGRTPAGDWWQIKFADGQDGAGWVAAEVVTFSGDTATVPTVEAPIPAPAATSGATPSTGEAAPAPTLSRGGQAGTPAPGAVIKVPPGGVNVRSGPGLNFDLLGRLPDNATAAVVGRNGAGDWWQIEYPGGEAGRAWVADAVVDFSGAKEDVPVITEAAVATPTVVTDTPTPTPTEVVIAGSIEVKEPVNIRAEPSTEGDLLGGMYMGETADVLAVSQDGKWWLINFADSPDGTGWVAAEFVRFQGDRAAVPVFGASTPTPTPGSTDTPTATPPQPTATPVAQPTYAPTATSVYQATAVAIMEQKGTPGPAAPPSSAGGLPVYWSDVPWGVLALLVVAIFFWYQLYYRRHRGR